MLKHIPVVRTPAATDGLVTKLARYLPFVCMVLLHNATIASAEIRLAPGFVYLRDIDGTIVQEIRYCGYHNFLGRPVKGYRADECILTRPAAEALKLVQEKLRPEGLSLKVYDCYRPAQAVADFVQWAQMLQDVKTKGEFYPEIDKQNLFALGYIATRSKHSRGSTVDLTIVPLVEPKPHDGPQPNYTPGQTALQACHEKQRFPDGSLDFGTGYDCFHELSHTMNPAITGVARDHRNKLVKVMAEAGFQNYRREWWHFELRNEPFEIGFNFPVVAHPSRPEASCPPQARSYTPQRSRRFRSR
jgi:D-alanyl-D-alanine dipeptidase